MSFRDYVKSTVATTQGRIVFILGYGLCWGAVISMFTWNRMASNILVLGFVVVAQTAVNAYFKDPKEDEYKQFLVEYFTIAYVTILLLSLYLWNDVITGEVISGATLFTLKIVSEYFGISMPMIATAVVKSDLTTEPPKTP